MNCTYPSPTNTTIGFDKLIEYVGTAAETCNPGIGGNLIALMFIIPMWFILFIILSRFDSRMAFPTASFVCSLIVLGFMTMEAVNPMLLGFFIVMTAAGTAMAFFGGRD